MPAQLCHDWVQDRNWAVQRIVLWVATCSACLHLWEGRERQWGTMFENWGLAIRGGVSGSGWCDHGDEVHALFAICSVVAITRQWVCVLPGPLESSYPQLPPFFTCSGENNSRLFSFGGAICKILVSSLLTGWLICRCGVFVLFFINRENNNLFYCKSQ